MVGCTEHRHVGLTLGNGIPIGFGCTNAMGPLALRAVDAANMAHVNLVVDFIPLHGVPSCQPGALLEWCQEPGHGDCAPDVSVRRCFEMPPFSSLGGADVVAQAASAAYAQLQGDEILADAPDGPLLVRIVATAEPCASVLANGTYAMDELVGCVLSCPVVLDEVDGEVRLELPVLGHSCTEAQVDGCAYGTL